MEHFDGDRTIVLDVVRQKHRRHAATSHLPLDGVDAGESILEQATEIWHGCPVRRGEGRRSILRGRRGDSEPRFRATYCTCDHDSTRTLPSAPHAAPRHAHRGTPIGPTNTREPARLRHAARRRYGY